MIDQKFEVGQQVEALWNAFAKEYRPAIIKNVKHVYVYTVEFTDTHYTYDYDEDRIRLPRLGPQEAWEKATMLIGKRSHDKAEYCCLAGEEVEDFNRETRHQVYQILGSASIRVTDEVKRDVRRLIGIADEM